MKLKSKLQSPKKIRKGMSVADQIRSLKRGGRCIQPAHRYQYLWNLSRRLGIRLHTQQARTESGEKTGQIWVTRIA